MTWEIIIALIVGAIIPLLTLWIDSLRKKKYF